ncbi:unnamed protein product [Aureobasidium uvarum]|uniref:Oxidoreductase n=1 Tax=Aureobasidium uvarum TaxID=2773716 RepID=A0A9N8KHC1_9PEZI|nr:unnamed protein product [Aureobasidium uvarum]
MPFNPATDIGDLSGKVIFVTGGTSGIGKAAVLALAAHHPSEIYFTGRNTQAGRDVTALLKSSAPSVQTHFIECDLASPRQTIREAIVAGFTAKRLDILIANAGIMATPAALTKEGFEIQFGTNYLGHAVLVRVLREQLLRTAQQGSDTRLVVVSSFGHTLAPPSGIDFDALRTANAGTTWQRYGQSKLADIYLAKSFARHFPQVTSVSVHPGLVRTQLSNGVESSWLTPVFKLLRWTPLYQSADKGAWNVLWAATAPKDQIKNGMYYEPVGKEPGKAAKGSGQSETVKDEALAERLWQWTEGELSNVA